MNRAAVVVESRASAMREAGDVIAADIPRDRPRWFKSTGMSWEDAVVASALASR